MDGKINVDYIGVVFENLKNKKLEYKQVPIINKNDELVGVLNDILENDNKTVLDMQGYFTRIFRPDSSLPAYNYCHPHNYSSSYISYSLYPKIFAFDEYRKNIEDFKNDEMQRMYLENIERVEVINRIHELLSDYNKQLKREFLYDAIRYINAFGFTETLSYLKTDSANKMFSSDSIGWTIYNYDVNKDITFQVKSNFGYGSSSYFFVNLKYKGVDILPYSDTVKYFYANMMDFIRYTRLYHTERDNWNIALSFVVETTNDAISDESEFVNKWIVNEINEMMTGLERIATNPHKIFERFVNNQSIDLGGLASVRNISNQTIEFYKIYPKELVLSYQVEKMSGSLFLLEKLKELSSIYPKVFESIERIIEINNNLLPSFKSSISSIKEEIEFRKTVVEQERHEKTQIELECKPDFEAIMEIVNEKRKHNIFTSENMVTYEYIKTHTRFFELYNKIQSLDESIKKKESDIANRNLFAQLISKCIEQMIKNLSEVA